MEAWLPLLAFGVGMGMLMVLLSRYQARRYQEYLDRHGNEAAKMVEQQKATKLAIDRQTAALERIAEALEKRT